MSAWSDENAIKAFEYGLSIPAHKLQLGQEFELIRFKYLILILYTVKYVDESFFSKSVKNIEIKKYGSLSSSKFFGTYRSHDSMFFELLIVNF